MADKHPLPFLLLLLPFLLATADASSLSSSYPARLAAGFLSNAAASLLHRVRSLKPAARTVASGGPRSAVKYESGYSVETVFDGSKLGIEPYAVELAPGGGELLVLDAANSNVYRVGLPLSRHSRPRLVAGSPDGYAGHVDGRLREARLNHPKGIAVDDKGNIYVADAMNMAIRKISDTGITTIAGGKSSRGGHVDGPSDDAKFSSDFEVRYVGSSCSLLIIDRGNQAIREIPLHFEDCAYQYETAFPLGVALLLAAAFFGYMIALLQRRVLGMVSAKETQTRSTVSTPPYQASLPPYQKPSRPSLLPPLIPPEGAAEKEEAEEQLFSSIGKLLGSAKSSLGALFSRKKQATTVHFQHQQRRSNSWPVQESYSIAPDDEPPPAVDTRTPTPRKNYAFMSKDPEKIHHLRHTRPHFNSWDGGAQQQNHPQQQPESRQQMLHQQHLQQHRQYSSAPQTIYEQSCETTNEIVFGAVQEMDSKRRTVEIKAVNYGDAYYEQYGMRYRNNYMGYSSHY